MLQLFDKNIFQTAIITCNLGTFQHIVSITAGGREVIKRQRIFFAVVQGFAIDQHIADALTNCCFFVQVENQATDI